MIGPVHPRPLAALTVALLAAVEMLGCGGGSNGSSATQETCLATIGMPCTSNAHCSGCSGGYCLSSGICSRPCGEHQDCGCPAGTINMDIADGKCDVACGQISTSVSGCMMVCSSNSDCAGTATCASGTGYGICK